MAFCNNCGYLLPVDFKDRTLCNACRLINAQSYIQKKCDCEFCHNTSNLNVQNSEADKHSDQKWHDDLNLRSLYHQLSSDGDRESDHVQSDEENQDFYISNCFEHPVNTEDVDMASSDECESEDEDLLTEPLYTSTSTFHDNANLLVDQEEDSGWTMVSYHNKMHDNMSGLQEKELEVEMRKEDQVSDTLRGQWTQEQEELLKTLITEDTHHIARLTYGDRRKSNGKRFYVGGVDISFIKGNNVDACACLSVVQMPNLELVYQRMEMIQLTQPYIPGFLAFREVQPLKTLFEHLKKTAPHYMPDVVMVDGNGILHPRGFGLASHLGVVLDMPTIGVAKTLMSAQGVTDDEEHKKKKQKLYEAGHGFDLISQTSGGVIGKCLRVHDEAPNPIYVSVGHKISLKSASWIALETSQYRIPEPVRRADLDSREYIRQNKSKPQEYIRL